MSWMIIAAAIVLGLATGVGAWFTWQALNPTRRLAKANLQRGTAAAAPANRHAQVTTSRRRESFTELTHKLTPELVIRVLDRQLMLAGRPAAWPLDKLLSLKLLWVAFAFVFNALILFSTPAPLLVLLSISITVIGYFLPELLANSAAQKRGEQIEHELADTLDQMTIAVEAGLGFDGALARAGENGRGPLAEELMRTLQDIRVGQSRRQAFKALSERTNVPDLRRFVRAIIQADVYGISIAGVLHTQADEMRLKRRQRAEEKAQKIPVKVLGPLMLCILPVLFIVVMGPAVMNIVEAFGAM